MESFFQGVKISRRTLLKLPRFSKWPPNEQKKKIQPRPQGLLLVQNGGRRNPWPRLPKWLRKFVRISSRKHNEMSSFCLNNGFRLQKTNWATRRWKQPPKKPFHHVSRDKILHDSWSISAALARGFSDRQFERGEDPGDEVEENLQRTSKYGHLRISQDICHVRMTDIEGFLTIYGQSDNLLNNNPQFALSLRRMIVLV